MNYLQELTTHPDNPRYIRADEFENLKKSLIVFIKMLDIRPIAYDENNIIWGGNMRFKALQELHAEGLILEIKDSWFKQLIGFTEEEKQQFAIKDNKEYGQWDWDIMANKWSDLPLEDWGINTVGWLDKDENEPADKLWEGMPEFGVDEHNKPFKTLFVHFTTEADYIAFGELTKCKLTPDTKYVWFPDKEKSDMKSIEFVNEEDAA